MTSSSPLRFKAADILAAFSPLDSEPPPLDTRAGRPFRTRVSVVLGSFLGTTAIAALTVSLSRARRRRRTERPLRAAAPLSTGTSRHVARPRDIKVGLPAGGPACLLSHFALVPHQSGKGVLRS